jgi:hypothetical protein
MKIIGVVETKFSASHTVIDHPQCGELHGHEWHVRIEIPFLDASLIPGVISEIVAYHRKDLNRFLPGVETTCSGLAFYFREKLSDFPVEAIEITTDDGLGARVEWPNR